VGPDLATTAALFVDPAPPAATRQEKVSGPPAGGRTPKPRPAPRRATTPRTRAASVPAPAPERTRAELYRVAQQLDIPGRSRMTRDELASAVAKAERG
jgi:hypothetical protein